MLFVGKETIDLIRRYQAVSEVSSGALFRRIRRGDTVTAHRLTLNGARQAIKDAAELVGIHLRSCVWSFASCRLCGVSCQSGGFGRRDAECRHVEVATDASALCTGAGGRAGGCGSAQVWEGEVGNDLQNTQSHGVRRVPQ